MVARHETDLLAAFLDHRRRSDAALEGAGLGHQRRRRIARPSSVLVKRGLSALSPEKSRLADRYGKAAPTQPLPGVKARGKRIRAEIELVVADGRGFDADDVVDRDIDRADRHRAADGRSGRGVDAAATLGSVPAARNGPGRKLSPPARMSVLEKSSSKASTSAARFGAVSTPAGRPRHRRDAASCSVKALGWPISKTRHVVAHLVAGHQQVLAVGRIGRRDEQHALRADVAGILGRAGIGDLRRVGDVEGERHVGTARERRRRRSSRPRSRS